MSRRLLSFAFTFIAGVLLGAGSLLWAKAQTSSQPPAAQSAPAVAAPGHLVFSGPPGRALLGSDSLGLRIVSRRQGKVVGTLMANVDGNWVEVQLAPQNALAGH